MTRQASVLFLLRYASSRALDRKSLVSTHASNMRKSIIGHEHHLIRRLLASRMGFPEGTA